jgi:hypothetical protein
MICGRMLHAYLACDRLLAGEDRVRVYMLPDALDNSDY